MSQQGFHLHSFGKYFVKFKEGERRQMDYRLELVKDAKKKYMTNEKIQQYEESGWHYLASDSNFHVYEALAANRSIDLPINLTEQLAELDSLHKKAMGNFILILVGIVVMLMLFVSTLFLGAVPTIRLMEGTLFSTFVLLLLNLYYLYTAVRELRGIHNLRESIKEGQSINHNKGLTSNFRLHIAVDIFFVILLLCGTMVPIIQLMKMETATLPMEETALPFVRLAAIENHPQLERNSHLIDEVDWSNFYSSNWSMLAPVQYEVHENGIVKEVKRIDSDHPYSPSMESKIYQVRFNMHVSPLVTDLMKWYSFADVPHFVEKQHPKLDQLLIRDTPYKMEFIFTKANVVMYLKYNGDSEPDVIIEQAVEKIVQLTEN